MGIDQDRKKQRDARVDQLVKLTKEWSAATKAEYNDRADMLKRLLKGRGVGAAAQTTVAKTEQLVVDEIDNFLAG